MNAGAMGGWIFDVVESIEWLTPQGRVRAARRDCFDALYRDCPQLHGAVAALRRAAFARRRRRRRHPRPHGRHGRAPPRLQPREASAGCVFRNPEGDKAGRLIDVSGLKGRLAVGPCDGARQSDARLPPRQRRRGQGRRFPRAHA
jgi:UDP-N-acetylenolpyruvoylglucosamine reductase